MHRRQFLKVATATTLASPALRAHAQETFPTRPITIVVSTGPGGLPDHTARLYAERMSTFLKQSVLVENMPGAGGLLAARRVTSAPPDGYLLLSMVNSVVAQPLLNSKAGYTIKSVTPLAELGRTSLMVLTASSSPFKNLGELIAAAKANPGKISYGSSGINSANHVSAEFLASKAGVKFLHVPYKGIAAAMPDVVAGRLGFVMTGTSSGQELMKSGALRGLAISSARRLPAMPDVPTMAEQGHAEAAYSVWTGVFAPAGLPSAVKARLSEALEHARSDPKLMAAIQGAGFELSTARTPDQFSAMVAAEDENMRKIIKDANLPVE